MKEQELTEFLDYVICHYSTKAGSKKLWQGLTISQTTKQVAQQYLNVRSTIVVYIERTKYNHYCAYAKNVEGVYGSGNTLAEVKQSIKESIRLLIKHNKPENLPAILKRKYTIQFRDPLNYLNKAASKRKAK